MMGRGKTRFLCGRQDELFRLWEAGKNDCRIAEDVGCTPSAICQWRKKTTFRRMMCAEDIRQGAQHEKNTLRPRRPGVRLLF